MKAFFEHLYASPYGRLARRFVVVGLSASIAVLFAKVNTADPLVFVNNVFAFTGADWLMLLKVFIGAGVLAGFDKLRRELSNM